ncbi:MAG: hypothetical protein IBX43_00815 [Campylobacterales bacterium]|nr:hypothetical protein [Campylobacterales bacterium]
MLKTFLSLLAFALLFLGCSSKERYKPSDTEGSLPLTQRFESSIAEISGETATLEDGRVITKEGLDLTRFPKGYRFVFKNEEWSLAVKTGGEIFAVKNENESRVLRLPKTVAAASLKGDLLAVIFADNELALYDFGSAELIFKEPASESTAVDMRIANPRFLNDLVLFPTLDGKIVIVNAQTKILLRTIIVSSEQYFNNIIYFAMIDDALYAATPYKIYTLGEKESRIEIEARNVRVDTKGVWVATKQGELIAMTHSLEIVARQKFPFAHFLGLIVTDDLLYAAEKNGYIITAPHDLSSSKVYDFSLEEGFFYTSDEGFYFDNVYLKVR